MGRKSASKQHHHGPQPPAPEPAARRVKPIFVGVIAVVLLAIGFLVFRNDTQAPAPESAAAKTADEPASTPDSSAPSSRTVPVSAETQKRADTLASFGPRKQGNLPPIPFRGYAPPRPPEVIAAAYHFAAEHPEILSYVPCFCGCERSGHQGNHDCFVKSRAANGDVIEWDEHGIECAVCIDVATRSRQMHTSGASARDIRAAIEKEYASATLMTPTAHPPAHAGHAGN
jgi:uncharacterized protein with PCYCGC motif